MIAGRQDHVSPTRSAEYPVGMTSRADGTTTEWATVEYAVDRLQGYYDEDPDADPWIEAALREGAALRTVSFIYRIAE
jgi:hypothetical protein